MSRRPVPTFSRTGFSSPLGKLTGEVPKVKVPEETLDILQTEARKAGLSLSEFVRDVLMVRAHGKEVVLSLYKRRLDVVASSGKERE